MKSEDYRIIQREYGDSRVVYVVQERRYEDRFMGASFWIDIKECQTEQIARAEKDNILKDLVVKETVLK
jgi:hypothetical protein